jgi:hypothetical protein
MKKLLLLLLLVPSLAQAGTLTVTTSGFANTPATAPSDWPSNLTYPANAPVNGTKTYTINDADYQKMLAWAANANNPQIVAAANPAPPAPPTCGNTPLPPCTVTGLQVLVSLVQNWVNGMIQAVQVHNTVPAQQPPPITIQ